VLALATLIVLPLVVIGLQLTFDLDNAEGLLGLLGYSLYKFFFLIPPLIYCRVKQIGVAKQIFKFRNWRGCLRLAFGLGLLSMAVFWGVYYLFGDMLLDKEKIVAKMADQFKVNAATVLLIAPVTILFNSMLEEFFHRGFSFGLLVKKQRWLGYLLPASVFTLHHILFIYQWLTPVPLIIAIFGLFVFALVLQKIYETADSIVAPWLIHVFGDVAMMVIAMTLLWG